MLKRVRGKAFNSVSRYYIIPRLNTQTTSPVDIAGSLRGMPKRVSMLKRASSEPFSQFARWQIPRLNTQTSSPVDIAGSSRGLLGNFTGLVQCVEGIPSCVVAALGDLYRLTESAKISLVMALQGALLSQEKLVLWCLAVIILDQEDLWHWTETQQVAYCMTLLQRHQDRSGYPKGSQRAPNHDNDPYQERYIDFVS